MLARVHRDRRWLEEAGVSAEMQQTRKKACHKKMSNLGFRSGGLQTMVWILADVHRLRFQIRWCLVQVNYTPLSQHCALSLVAKDTRYALIGTLV